jgi:hypothetical protein
MLAYDASCCSKPATLLNSLLQRVWTSTPPPDQNDPLQPNASGAQNSIEPSNSLMQLLDTYIPQNAPLSERVAVLDKVTKLMDFTGAAVYILRSS